MGWRSQMHFNHLQPHCKSASWSICQLRLYGLPPSMDFSTHWSGYWAFDYLGLIMGNTCHHGMSWEMLNAQHGCSVFEHQQVPQSTTNKFRGAKGQDERPRPLQKPYLQRSNIWEMFVENFRTLKTIFGRILLKLPCGFRWGCTKEKDVMGAMPIHPLRLR